MGLLAAKRRPVGFRIFGAVSTVNNPTQRSALMHSVQEINGIQYQDATHRLHSHSRKANKARRVQQPSCLFPSTRFLPPADHSPGHICFECGLQVFGTNECRNNTRTSHACSSSNCKAISKGNLGPVIKQMMFWPDLFLGLARPVCLPDEWKWWRWLAKLELASNEIGMAWQ